MSQIYSRICFENVRTAGRRGARISTLVPVTATSKVSARSYSIALSKVVGGSRVLGTKFLLLDQQQRHVLVSSSALPATGARRWFQSSVASQKKKGGKSDDNDDPESGDKPKKEQKKNDADKKIADEVDEKGSRRRRAPRRSENEKAAADNGGDASGAQVQRDPLTQLKRAVGVADYAQGQQSFIPDNYPNVMMLPITRRPLFPSLYKSIQVQDPQVIGALRELVDRGEPYVATFMLKDDEKDVDAIKKTSEVHEIGVFSRIMSIYVSPNPEDKHLTVALYPWRRVRMKRILGNADPAAKAATETDVDSLLEAPKSKSVTGPSGTEAIDASKVLNSIKSDYDFTAIEVENVEDEPYDAKDATISATMSEIVS
ncbi:ATP-dependent Lon protease pim1, partial [Kickxella alabastrina]